MRWLLVACLGAVLATTLAQVPSIDDDIHLQDKEQLIFTDPPVTLASQDNLQGDEHSAEGQTTPDNINQRDNSGSQRDSNEQLNSQESGDTDEAVEQNSGDGPQVSNEGESGSDAVESTNIEETSEDSNEDVKVSGENGQASNENGQESNGEEENTSTSNENGQESNGEEENISTSNENGQESNGEEENTSTSNENSGDESAETESPSTNESGISKSGESDSREGLSEIQTEGGPVQGFYFRDDSTLGIRSYFDIPYGKFSGLFKAPSKAAAWDYVLENREHMKRCPQISESNEYTGELDCLTLSVFAPSDVENAAVIFHIHDGDFRTGSGNPSIYGPEHLVPKGIILVLPNYRVGPLGFLCMKNNVAPGNAALKDLTLALDWTKTNIAKFGGDPSKIVVSGDGRAGALAGYLALSPMSRDFISGVITESGSVLAPWAIDRNPIAFATKLAEVVEQDVTNDINLELLVTSAKDIHFKPCIESGTDAFLNVTPWEILHDKENKITIPFMIGSANHAGMQEAMLHTEESLPELNEDFSKLLPNDLEFDGGESEKTKIGKQIKEQYFGEEAINLNHRENMSLFYTDAFYLGPSIRVARPLVNAGVKVYFYEFSFVGDLNRELSSLGTPVQGAARGDIVGYAFMQDGDAPLPETEEEHMVDLITDLWVIFAQTGQPVIENIAWKELTKVEEAEEEWLSIENEVKVQKGLYVTRLALWTEIYNNHFVDRNHASAKMSSCSLFLFTAALVLGFRNIL